MKIARSSDSLISLSDEYLSDLCHQLSHDIGNPLTAIISYSSILEQAEHFSISLDKVGNYASNISRETWRISRLMEKFLLLVSRKVVLSPFPVRELRQRIEARYRSRYELNTLSISFNGFDAEAIIFADIDQCCSIICEIATNAVAAQNILQERGILQKQGILNKTNPELSITFIEDQEQFIFETENPCPVHTKELSLLLQPGEKEYSRERESLGIGLSAISSAMSKWNAYLEIQETMDNTVHENIAIFKTRLIFPKK